MNGRAFVRGLTLATLVLCLMVSFPSQAQDGGVVLDAPVVTKLPGDMYLFNKPAFVRVDDEMKRLQALERAHKAEPSWATPVLVGILVGVTGGLVTGLLVRSALDAIPKSP